MRWTSVRTINATTDRVFRAVADPEEFQKAIVGGSSVEYLTGSRSGVGMKFRSTRLVKGKPDPDDGRDDGAASCAGDDPPHCRDGSEGARHRHGCGEGVLRARPRALGARRGLSGA